MNNVNTDNKFIQMFVLLVTLFVFIFFTKGYYSDLISTMDINEKNIKVEKEKITESDTLSKKQKELEKALKKGGIKSKESVEIKKYLKDFSEDKIIDEIYGYSFRTGGIKINSLSIGKGVKNELGFMESKISISAIIKDKEKLIDFLDYLIEDSNYKFFINNLNLPKDIGGKGFNIQIPLTLFYVESK